MGRGSVCAVDSLIRKISLNDSKRNERVSEYQTN